MDELDDEYYTLSRSMPLTAQDRCDNCGAQAYVETTVNGTALLWCGSHYRRFEARLVAASTRIRDFRFMLDMP